MPSPRPAPVAGSVSPYVLECRMLKAYRRLLLGCDLDQLIADAFGPNLSPSKAAAADDRLEYAMPELIQKLTPTQQGPLAELLLGEAPDLAAAVRELVKLENGLWRRDEDARLRDEGDDWKAKVVFTGKFRAPLAGAALQQRELAQAKAAVPLGPPLVLEPLQVVPRKPGLRTKKRRAVRCRAVFYWAGQYEIWPPVSADGALEGVL